MPFPILAQSEAFTVDQVLSPYVYVFYAAFAVTFILTPLMRLVAIHYGIIDEPDNLRKIHRTPVAYLGGVAVFMGWLAGLTVAQFAHMHRGEPGVRPHVVINFSIVVGACVIVILGLWDDVRRIKPWMKIAGQVFAALFLLTEGIGTECTAPLLTPAINRLYAWTGWGNIPDPLPAPIQWFITLSSSALVIMLVVGCCNATNLLDGLDGLCGGVTAIIAAGFLFVATHLATQGGGLSANDDAVRVVLGLALLGAVLGFVPFNFNPASIFMGDTGSMFLGFACATMIIITGQNQHPKWFLAAMVMFALPVLDTALAFTRRWVNRRPLFSADRHHFHHQLVARGFSVKQTVMISYGLAIVFALLGALIVYSRTRYAVALYLVIFAYVIVAAYKMGMVHERPRIVSRKELGDVGAARPAVETDSTAVLEIRDDTPSPAPAPQSV